MTIDILCRVVDNLGDIGFVYRLARALSELRDAPRLRLIVDDLAAFAGICPAVRPDAPLQTVENWQVVRWDNPGEEAVNLFLAERPRMVLECYACSRPPWFESILFDYSDQLPRYIVNLEYLTAETWARDFHKLPSLTRSPLVRKAFFMPGFQSGTGGLLQDAAFCDTVKACSSREGKLAVRKGILENREILHGAGQVFPDDHEASFWFLVFSYEHDFSQLVSDLTVFSADRPLLVLVAAGRRSGPFLEAWNRAGCPFPVLTLPLLPQPVWDSFLVASDFAIVRGEETLSRAILAGHPFLWQCYPFGFSGRLGDGKTGADSTGGQVTAGGQLPKVHAFLERIKPFLEPADFAAYERLTLAFNGDSPASSEPARGDLLAVLRTLEKAPVRTDGGAGGLTAGFASWAQEVRNLGNLAVNLLTFMRDLG